MFRYIFSVQIDGANQKLFCDLQLVPIQFTRRERTVVIIDVSLSATVIYDINYYYYSIWRDDARRMYRLVLVCLFIVRVKESKSEKKKICMQLKQLSVVS